MKRIYLKPEALVEAIEMEQSMMLSVSDSTPADDSNPLSRDYDVEDFAEHIVFIDMLE